MKLLLLISLLTLYPTQVNAESVSPASTSFERQVRQQINKARTHRNKRWLKNNSCTDHHSAEPRAKRMASNTRMIHYPRLGSVFVHCKGHRVGEIISEGFNNPRKVVRAWINSPTHRSILLGRYHTSSVGAWLSANGTMYISVIFMKY